MLIADHDSPLHPPSLPMLPGSEAAGEPWTFAPATKVRVSDRVREEAVVWTVAHELRQPLSVMTVAVAVLEHDSSTGPAAQAIAVMHRQLRHMSRMVDDLLDAARLTTGKVPLVIQRFDVRQVMADAAADIAVVAAERAQLLDVDPGAAPLWVSADRDRLHQVFSNLLGNAVKFTDRGGRITFTADTHDSKVVVRVRDTGRGIDPAALPRIFDLFAQGAPTGLGGVGIGLNVAREIVSLHRGQIEARSDGVGKGSEFAVPLPSSPAGTW